MTAYLLLRRRRWVSFTVIIHKTKTKIIEKRNQFGNKFLSLIANVSNCQKYHIGILDVISRVSAGIESLASRSGTGDLE